MPERTIPSPGDTVRIREQRWRVLRCRIHPDSTVLDVITTDPAGDDIRASFLLPFERCDRLPAIDRPRKVRPPEWRRIVRRVLADATPAWWSPRSAAGARIRVMPFQLEPLIALMKGRTTRTLIADAVGLGKTIQAGLIVAETIERVAAPHVVIVCPASLRSQWCDELEEKFGLRPANLDAAGLTSAVRTLPATANPWLATPLIVTSIDFVKQPEIIRACESVVWDLVVFDEAHALTGRSDRATAAAALARRSRAVVMLTATPHSGDEQAYERLVGLGHFPSDPPILVFRRNRSAVGLVLDRRTTALRVQPTADERLMHQALGEYIAQATESTGTLALRVLLRRATSSAASLAQSVERRISLLAGTSGDLRDQLSLRLELWDDDEVPDAELQGQALTNRSLELQLLRAVHDRAIVAARHESKLSALSRLLRRAGEPAIVFTQYRDTLATVATVLAGTCVPLHGGLTLSERRVSELRFTRGDAAVLLATDAASEGLNLHHRCRFVINLDVPWTPLRLEQRIGRVDRLGQSRRIHALLLVAAGTSEELDVTLLQQRASRASSAVPAASDRSPDADDESERILRARAFQANAASTPSCRPVVTANRRARLAGHRSLAAYGIQVVDRSGGHVWHALAALAPAPSGDLFNVKFALADWIEALSQQLIRERRGAITVWMHRELAIAAKLRESSARLSRALIQPGLFDRRTERVNRAQASVLADALRAGEERLNELAAGRQIKLATPVLLFAVRSL